MGTRNLTCVVLNDEFKVAQYGQWDGQPEVTGIGILNFLRDHFDKDFHSYGFIRHVGASEFINLSEVGIDETEWNIIKLAPQFSRDVGYKILNMLKNGPLYLYNDVKFAKDSLFCEWAYVVDLDNKTFEVYNGFRRSPVPEDNRFQLTQEDLEYHVGDYFPVALALKYKLNDLPTPEQFIQDVKRNVYGENEEEENSET